VNISAFSTLAQFLSGLSHKELAQRLNVTELKLQEMSGTSDFQQWSQQQDPEGVSWKISHNKSDNERCYLPNLAFSEEL
jgi:hypothetical protein